MIMIFLPNDKTPGQALMALYRPYRRTIMERRKTVFQQPMSFRCFDVFTPLLGLNNDVVLVGQIELFFLGT